MIPRPIATLVEDITRAGGRLVLKNDRLTLKAPGPLSLVLVSLVRTHKAAILLYLSTPPANRPEPCEHPKVFRRINGPRLCMSCLHSLALDAMTWVPEAAPGYCREELHDFAPEDARMPGLRQCQRCPAVVRVEVDHA